MCLLLTLHIASCINEKRNSNLWSDILYEVIIKQWKKFVEINPMHSDFSTIGEALGILQALKDHNPVYHKVCCAKMNDSHYNGLVKKQKKQRRANEGLANAKILSKREHWTWYGSFLILWKEGFQGWINGKVWLSNWARWTFMQNYVLGMFVQVRYSTINSSWSSFITFI